MTTTAVDDQLHNLCFSCGITFMRPDDAGIPSHLCSNCWESGGKQRPKRPDSHYRHAIRAPITDADIARGYTEVRLDPYRVCDVYGTGGGPREQMVKKLLRWTDKGQSEDQVLSEIESALNRWKQMRAEDAAVAAKESSQ